MVEDLSHNRNKTDQDILITEFENENNYLNT